MSTAIQPPQRWHQRLAAYAPPGEFGRYLVVGIWNTAFGYGTFALLTAVLAHAVPHSYLLASALSSLLNITVSFLGYKWFVFKTRGQYLREWARCVTVYSGGILFTLAALPVLVTLLRRYPPCGAAAPYIAGAVLCGVNVIYSFFGHKKFSFQR